MLSERIRRVVRRLVPKVACSACGWPQGGGRRIISGPHCYICEQCVESAAVRIAAGDAETAADRRCSFCASRSPELAIAEWPKLAICEECISVSAGIVAEDRARRLVT
jgi:ATP-dependent protease Clp ATPase subunit